MRKDYEMITVNAYIDTLDAECSTVSEKEIEAQVEKYLLNVKRNEINATLVEALLA